MEDPYEAAKAVKEITGLEIDGRTIRVEVTSGKRREPGSGRGAYGDGGRRDRSRDRR